MTRSPSSERNVVAELRGSQTPRVRVVPEYVTSAGQEALEVAALAGLELDSWEELVLVDALGERADGKWAAFEVGINCPRQNGKGTIQEARELAGLFAFGERLLIHSAHEQLTATEHFRRLLDLIEGVPEFESRVKNAPRGKGSEAIELKGGARILFKTRTGGGGRGLSGDTVGLDEAMILPVATTAALVPTMAAKSVHGNPQLLYAGSAVDKDKHEHGVVFTRLRERALAGASGVMYVEWSAGVRDWLEARGLSFDETRPEIDQITNELLDDPEMWAQANPGLGIRISLEHIAKERAGALGRREFAVERLGIADPPDTSEEHARVIPHDLYLRCYEHDPVNRIAGTKWYAIDASPDGAWASIGVGGTRGDGLQQAAVIEHRRGTDWIVEACKALNEDGLVRFALDKKGPAGFLEDDLRNAGVHPLLLSTEDYGEACGMFFAAVVAQEIRFPFSQPELEAALGAATWAKLGDRRKWDRRSPTGADISPLCAVTVAHWAAKTQGVPEVYDLNEIVARLRAGNDGESAPAEGAPVDAAPASAPSNFVPLGELPVGRSVFRP